jgi:beta-lactamase superfamily II metal-dependent hydrolase
VDVRGSLRSPRVPPDDGCVEYLDHDTARVWKTENGGRSLAELIVVLYRGDELEVLERKKAATKVRLGTGREGWVRAPLRTTARPPLALAFIDVGQGDACLVTTPSGHRVLVDGGENKLAARYLAARFWDETAAGKDVHFDAIVVTHGDADHFDGLSTLVLDAVAEKRDRKRIRVSASRVFHNGLVKRASSLPERERLGAPLDVGGRLLVPLVDDPRGVKDANRPFRRWQAALNELAARTKITVARLDDQSSDAFDFLGDVKIAVLGPRVERLKDGSGALPLLGGDDGAGISAARTINGHSVVLRVTYGSVTALLTGDLHAQMEAELVKKKAPLRADVLKVPHHGSDDVSRQFIEAVEPLVSVISAGDEDARRDYLHPRANLLAMLGQSRRGAEPVVFVTNLAAFDRWAGEAFYAVKDGDDWKPDVSRGTFYARERTAYGIIHVRTDGKRLFVARRGARNDRYEAYAYVVEADGSAASSEIDAV